MKRQDELKKNLKKEKGSLVFPLYSELKENKHEDSNDLLSAL